MHHICEPSSGKSEVKNRAAINEKLEVIWARKMLCKNPIKYDKINLGDGQI